AFAATPDGADETAACVMKRDPKRGQRRSSGTRFAQPFDYIRCRPDASIDAVQGLVIFATCSDVRMLFTCSTRSAYAFFAASTLALAISSSLSVIFFCASPRA